LNGLKTVIDRTRTNFFSNRTIKYLLIVFLYSQGNELCRLRRMAVLVLVSQESHSFESTCFSFNYFIDLLARLVWFFLLLKICITAQIIFTWDKETLCFLSKNPNIIFSICCDMILELNDILLISCHSISTRIVRIESLKSIRRLPTTSHTIA
jgi:hypothetical protein